MPSVWHIRDRSIVLQAKRWKVERSLRRRDDRDEEHEFFTIRMPDFVNIIAWTDADELVMVRQYRHGVERPTLEMPGGLVDPGEHDLASAARRELLEETGFEGVPRPLGAVFPNPALLDNRCHFFECLGARRVASPSLDVTEDAAVVLVPRRELDGLIVRGDIANALMVAGIKRWEAMRASG